MLVTAKCLIPAWDSEAALLYEPNKGPLPGGLFEIELDSKLAQLKTSEGPAGRYVFEFDRACPTGPPRNYDCDICGERCKSLNALGTHTNSKHPIAPEITEVVEDDDEPASDEVFADRTCPVCGQQCKSPYGMKVHVRKAHEEYALLNGFSVPKDQAAA